jgi:hypothetical protein
LTGSRRAPTLGRGLRIAVCRDRRNLQLHKRNVVLTEGAINDALEALRRTRPSL